MNNKINNKNVKIRSSNGKTYASIDNDEISILTAIFKKDKLIKLIGFYKKKPRVRGRCQLNLFLDYLKNKGHINDDYIVRVVKPTPTDGKTLNNTFKMYTNMGFNRVQTPTDGLEPLEQRVDILIQKLREPCKPKPRLKFSLKGLLRRITEEPELKQK